MIIDFHTHIFPEKVAQNALTVLSTKSGHSPSFDGTIDGLLKSMSEAGISLSVNMPVATSPVQVPSINKWCSSIRSDKIISFASYHPALREFSSICEIRKNKFPGVKFHPEFQDFCPIDPQHDDLWNAFIDNELWVFFHAGADFAFPPPYKSSPAIFAKLHEKFPKLKIILAHFGSWQMWDEVEKKLIASNIILDTSFALGFIEDQRLVELSRMHGIEKILFGSDTPWRIQKEELTKIYKLPFSKEEFNAILYKNSAKILKII